MIARRSNCENETTKIGRSNRDRKRKVILTMRVARRGDRGNLSIRNRKLRVAMISGSHSHCEMRLMGSRHQ